MVSLGLGNGDEAEADNSACIDPGYNFTFYDSEDKTVSENLFI